MAEILERLALCIFATAFYFVASHRMLPAIESCEYKNTQFFSWLKQKDNLWQNRLCLFCLILLLSCALTAMSFLFLGENIAKLLSLIPFTLFSSLFIVTEMKSAGNAASTEKRTKRVGAVYALILAIFVYIFIDLFVLIENVVNTPVLAAFGVLPVCLVPLFLPLFFALANGICNIFENPRAKRQAQKDAEKTQETPIENEEAEKTDKQL